MTSCFGLRSPRSSDTEPLLPQYNDETRLQSRVHEKLHTYQMLRALSRGYMPSTEQMIVHLRALMSSEVLNPRNTELTPDGRKLVRYAKQWLGEAIEVLRKKNGQDELQELAWCLKRAKVELETQDLLQTTATAKAKADARAAYESFHTVSDLLLTNSDFRKLFSDLTTVSRQVFADTAATTSEIAQYVSETVAPSGTELSAVNSKKPASIDAFPRKEAVDAPIQELREVITQSAAEAASAAVESVKENFGKEDTKNALLSRMKMVVSRLGKNTDYTASMSTLSLLLKRYARNYSRALDNTVSALETNIHPNPELDRGMQQFWSLITSFGERKEWQELEIRWHKVMEHVHKDPELEGFMESFGNAIESLLTDPEFLTNSDDKFGALREKFRGVGVDGSFQGDLDAVLDQAQLVFKSVIADHDISSLISTTTTIFHTLFPSSLHPTNPDIISDLTHVLLPLAVKLIQYIPIPRMTISAPELDLLLENLILEPGHTINNSSFLPFRLRLETTNDLEIAQRPTTTRPQTHLTSLATLKLDGISLRADDIGYRLAAHKGLLRFCGSGIAGFQMDGRGMDIHLSLEIMKDRVDPLLSLREVKVNIHNLTYNLRRSNFSWVAWLLKPFLKPLIKRVLERHLASSIEDGLHFLNRELIFTRERLRATRIAEPKDLRKFFKAVAARLTPAPNPDLEIAVGVSSWKGEGVFEGKYAPGSVVKLWQEEGERAGEVVDRDAVGKGGWRNEVFELQTRALTGL